MMYFVLLMWLEKQHPRMVTAFAVSMTILIVALMALGIFSVVHG